MPCSRGGNNGATKLGAQRLGHRMIGHTNPHCLSWPMNDLGNLPCTLQDETVRTGQKLLHDSVDPIMHHCVARNVAEVLADKRQLLTAIHPFDAVQPFDRLVVEEITAQPIDRICRVGDDLTVLQCLGGLLDLTGLWMMGVDFEQHDVSAGSSGPSSFPVAPKGLGLLLWPLWGVEAKNRPARVLFGLLTKADALPLFRDHGEKLALERRLRYRKDMAGLDPSSTPDFFTGLRPTASFPLLRSWSHFSRRLAECLGTACFFCACLAGCTSNTQQMPKWPAQPSPEYPEPPPSEGPIVPEAGATVPPGGNARSTNAPLPGSSLAKEYKGKKPLKTLEGEASYYADSLAGNHTASGEIYDPDKFTAAHKELPFGTIARVIREDDGRVTYVKINDRGPFAGKERIIDLSRAAAEQLEMLKAGVVDVRVEIVEQPE